MMNGFILYKKREEELTPHGDYSVLRFKEAAVKMGISLRILCPEQFDLVVTHPDRKSILINGQSTQLPDFVIPRMGSETTYFGLAVIRQLERLGVYCCNSSVSIEHVKDKLYVHQMLAQSNLPTPQTMMVKFPINLDIVKKEIGFPIVVKNIIGTRGEGIYLSESESRFLDLMELIRSYNAQANIILQEFIKTSSGRDLRVFVIGGQVIGAMLRQSETSFKANFSMGGKVEPFAID
ncbi:MAG: RimK family alpha-L-glutamate ligase, partial [Chlamydiia bacterium]|nr:RimK family alpha-L-glutamate ligase [Chlamydiia bacterium]